MSPVPVAERVALVGATSQVGQELKGQLARVGYPGNRIELLDLEDEVGLVTDYGDEARVVLEAARGSLAAFRLACFCDSPAAARELAPAVTESGGLVVDCTGAFAGDAGPLAGDGSDPGPGDIVTVPHPGTLLLRSLAVGAGLEGAVSTLLLPASERHSGGAENMARQAAALLNFGETSADDGEAFGRRIAFDLWPDDGGVGERIAAELQRLGLSCPRLFVLRAPVFHSLSATLWIPEREPRDVADALGAAGVAVDARDDRRRRIDSPARAAGRHGPHVASLRADGGGTWAWAVLDNHHAVAAAALQVLAAHLQPPDEVQSP